VAELVGEIPGKAQSAERRAAAEPDKSAAVPVDANSARRRSFRLDEWIHAANQRPRLCLAVLAAILAAQISPWFYPTGDGSMYLSTVRELLTTDDLSEFRCFVPPGYVLLILPTFLVSSRPFLALSVLNWLLGVALLIGTHRWARRQFPSAALLLTALVMVNISVWTYYRRPLKEIAFMAVLIWCVNLLHDLMTPKTARRTILYATAASLLLTFLSMIRYPGITVVIGFGLAMGLQAYRRCTSWTRAAALSAAVGLLPVAVLASWLVYDKYYVGGAVYWHEIVSVYTDEIDGGGGGAASAAGAGSFAFPWAESHFMRVTLPRFLDGLQYRITDLGCMTLPGLWKAVPETGRWLDVWRIIYITFFLVVIIGWWRAIQRKTDVLILTLPAYFLLYVHWVCDQPGGRFMLPMLPAVIACTWVAIGSGRKYRLPVFAALLFLHFGQASAYWLLIDAPRAARAHAQWPAVDQLAETIRTEPHPVGARDVPLEMFLALGLTLDRHTPLQIVEEPIDPAVFWIVAPESEANVAGFSPCETAGGYVLLSRRPPQETPPRPLISANQAPLRAGM